MDSCIEKRLGQIKNFSLTICYDFLVKRKYILAAIFYSPIKSKWNASIPPWDAETEFPRKQFDTNQCWSLTISSYAMERQEGEF